MTSTATSSDNSPYLPLHTYPHIDTSGRNTVNNENVLKAEALLKQAEDNKQDAEKRVQIALLELQNARAGNITNQVMAEPGVIDQIPSSTGLSITKLIKMVFNFAKLNPALTISTIFLITSTICIGISFTRSYVQLSGAAYSSFSLSIFKVCTWQGCFPLMWNDCSFNPFNSFKGPTSIPHCAAFKGFQVITFVALITVGLAALAVIIQAVLAIKNLQLRYLHTTVVALTAYALIFMIVSLSLFGSVMLRFPNDMSVSSNSSVILSIVSCVFLGLTLICNAAVRLCNSTTPIQEIDVALVKLPSDSGSAPLMHSNRILVSDGTPHQTAIYGEMPTSSIIYTSI